MNAKLQISSADLTGFRIHTQAAQNRVENSTKQAFQQTAQKIFNDALNNTPRQTGALAASGNLADKSTGSFMQYVISFGDSTVNPNSHAQTAEYAIKVHEEFNPASPDSYKWLEKTINSYSTGTFVSELANAIRAAIG